MKKVIKIIVFILCIAGFVYFGTLNQNSSKSKKGSKISSNDSFFGSAYVFESINHSKLLSKLNSSSDSFIVYACFEKNDLCSSYGELINEIAINYEIETIYYYDFKTDKETSNATYQKIVSKLSDYLITDDLGNQDLYAPSLIFIKNGDLYAIDDDLVLQHGKKTSSDILTDEKLNEKREVLINIIEGYLTNE
ncbi:MAG: hypothetical protein J5634_04610 [Bacilli bacterium]|nr:hypothetical protein [Bacilli bacterium]